MHKYNTINKIKLYNQMKDKKKKNYYTLILRNGG